MAPHAFSDPLLDEAEHIKKIFKQWDADGNGTIEKNELSAVMFKISPSMTLEDIDKLLMSIDKDGDGVIDFEEFVSWLTNPDSTTTISTDGWLVNTVKVETLLKPLFQVFDKNSDGVIQMTEFQESFNIITNSIRMHAGAGNDSPLDGVLQAFTTRFEGFEDKTPVPFEEFVQWHRKIFEKSGIPNNQLQSVVGSLAEHLGAIIDIDRKRSSGMFNTNNSFVALTSAVQKLADVSLRLYTAKKHLFSSPQTIQEDEEHAKEDELLKIKCFWQDPPAGIVPTLMRTCSQVQGMILPTSAYQESEPSQPATHTKSRRKSSALLAEIPKVIGRIRLIIPEFSPEGELTRWLAEVVRLGGTDEESFIYEYDEKEKHMRFRRKGGWKPLPDDTQLQEAWACLPRELQLYALLRTKAIMERTLNNALDWPSVQSVLEEAEDRGIMPENALRIFNTDMHRLVMDEMRDNDAHHDALEMGLTVSEAADEQLEKLQLSPIDVLGTLADLKQIQVSDEVWSHLLDARIALHT